MRYTGFSKILSESIIDSMKEYINEEIEEHCDEVNNIDNAADLIKAQWTSPDDVFHIAINQRAKDNGGKANLPDSWFRNGKRGPGCNYIAYAVISGKTVEDCINNLYNCEIHLSEPYNTDEENGYGKDVCDLTGIDGIKELCERYNARAYMSINKRSLSQAMSNTGENLQNATGRGLLRDLGIVKGYDREGRPWGLIDCDTDDPEYVDKLRQYLKDNNIEVFKETESPNGVHFWCKDRSAENLDYSDWENCRDIHPEKYTDRRWGDDIVHFGGDSPIILYSGTGKYNDK